MPHILVVCTANICRSPVGEALIRDRLHKRGLPDWTVSSAGTWALQRRGASRYSVEVMEEAGLDITQHIARMIDADAMRRADLVLCMETGHAEALRVEFPQEAHKVFLMSEMIGYWYSIQDPYGSERPAYEQMAAELTSIIDMGLDRIIELAELNADAGERPATSPQ